VGRVNEQHLVQPLGGPVAVGQTRSKLVKKNVYNAVYPEVRKTADMLGVPELKAGPAPGRYPPARPTEPC
jgi:hypothetical protein